MPVYDVPCVTRKKRGKIRKKFAGNAKVTPVGGRGARGNDGTEQEVRYDTPVIISHSRPGFVFAACRSPSIGTGCNPGLRNKE